MMTQVTSISIGCGFHGGDPHVMRKTVAMAKKYDVAVGAHPGFPDPIGFGRRKMEITPEEARDYILYQVGALKAFCEAYGIALQHVKPHGQLYNMAWTDEKLARSILEAIREVKPEPIFLALYNTMPYGSQSLWGCGWPGSSTQTWNTPRMERPSSRGRMAISMLTKL